jgi:two-component system, NtrC family, sensor histidine kinase KinB
MGALVIEYEQIRNFKVTRYFTALSVILGVPLMALLSEATVRLSGTEAARGPMFGFSFLTILLLFIVLLIVVRRAEAILTERTLALEEQKQWRTDFTNLLVHDLKNPLSVVSVTLSLILSGRLDKVPDGQKGRLERAQRSTKEALDLVDNLLDIEKLEVGALRLVPTSSDLPALLNTSIESVRSLAEVFDIQLTASIADNLPTLKLDQALVQRVVQNLLTNAIKFTPQQGSIQLETKTNGQSVLVSVVDTGPGVPPEQRERIFDKFVQLQGTERRGAGLGLTFCKLAVEAHGGRIWVEESPTGGSCFTFSLQLS